MKKVIDQDRNVKCIVVDPHGIIKVYYRKFDKDGNDINHPEIILNDVICGDFKHYKKMVTKAMKSGGSLYSLLELMTSFGFIVFYDSTNYNNHHKNKDHDGVMSLPCDIDKMSDEQYTSFKKVCNELPINDTGNSYHAEDELEYEMYKKINLYRFDKKGYTSLGNLGEDDYSYDNLFGDNIKRR